MFFIYILYSPSSDKYYLGYTEDVSKRIFMHNNPIRTSYTSKHRPWILKKAFKVGNNKTLALKIEQKIKKMKSRKYLEQLLDPQIGEQMFGDLLISSTPDC
ncbi:GIY-YIG nuclease family protein [Labilibaculum euxinus]|uniref:GIY-YIG nuclease family protein n=1 Tax=Labilibaculum euxinus TaxID=2686357 RepID=A0A7M4D4Y3_9BACT|nr:GIY-YIG nuclease family protein [Labilibaculum euxinus]MUP37712.1 GIY-YIG nuclease family protein [Labilibaculum euxinus]MVB06917.1 GIY-YIG nuclease family protein [Labilibaculum euxinus]